MPTPRTSRPSRRPERVGRVLAGSALIALLVGVPAVALTLTDTLPGTSLAEVVTTGRLDAAAVVQVVSLVFLLLWAWFAVTAIDEAWRLVRHRRSGLAGPLPEPPPSPTGLARRLVRTALLSSGALLVPVIGASCGRAPTTPVTVAAAGLSEVRPAAAAVDQPAGWCDETEPVVLRSSGRDTPYSIAVRLGDPQLRDAVIAANRGRVSPDGITWTGGVFPAGMEIELPQGVRLPQATRWRQHVVDDADSVFHIATTMATGGRVREVADMIIERNMGREMADGTVFDDPSLLRAGWVIEVPVVPSTPVAPSGTPAPVVPVAPVDPVVPVAPSPTGLPPPTGLPSPTGPPVAPPAGIPLGRSIAAALLLCAGALRLVHIRRRQRWRTATVDTVVAPPPAHEVRTERLLRSLDAVARSVRLDLALRSAGRRLIGSGARVGAVVMSDTGAVTLLLDRSGPATGAPWMRTSRPDRWHLPAEVDDDELSADARAAGQPCPALCHLGTVSPPQRTGTPRDHLDGDVFVDLEAIGVMSIAGPPDAARDIARAVAASLAVSPVGETVEVIAHALDVGLEAASDHLHRAASIAAALDRAATLLGPSILSRPPVPRWELRSRGVGGETWEAVVVVSGADSLDGVSAVELARLTEAGRGLAVVVAHGLPGAPAVLRASAAGWELQPFGITVVPVGLTVERIAAVDRLIEHAGAALPNVTRRTPTERATMPPPFVEPPWELLVRVLGPVGVTTRAGEAVRFERGRALELVVWLSQHRSGGTRTGARTAMWQSDVRDSTFSNIVSDARRALARTTAPPPDAEWIGRTLTDALPLHPLVACDADLLRARLEASRRMDHRPAIAVLTPGVELIDGLPFAGSDYLWPDAEGITSSLVVLATSAAAELGRHHLVLGDTDGVFRATGRGLAVLPGHEELIGLRMRAHAARGNLAGVRHEWEFYERALDADRWAGSDASPALVSLRHELLAGQRPTVGA